MAKEIAELKLDMAKIEAETKRLSRRKHPHPK